MKKMMRLKGNFNFSPLIWHFYLSFGLYSSSNLDSIKSKLGGKKLAQGSKSKKKDDDDEPDIEYVLGQDQREERKRKA